MLLLVSLYVFSWGPALFSKQELSRKYDVLTFSCTFFLFSLVSMLCDCMIQRGTSLCRSVFCAVCCYGLFPRGLCVHSYPKNRAPLWQHRSRLACDMRERFLSICLTPSFYLYLSLCLYLSVPPPLISSYLSPLIPPENISPFFSSVARIPVHSIMSVSVCHMIVAVKTALILDNTHFVGCTHCQLAG